MKIPRCAVCERKMVVRVEQVRKGKRYVDVEYYACRVHGAPGRM
jgi:CTP-dependent riboflavin kinase